MAFKDMDVREETTGKLAGAHMGQACCRLCNEEGSSQRHQYSVKVCTCQLPADDVQNDPVVAGHVVEGSSFWHRLKLQESCEVAFHKAANSSALRRALLCRLRPQLGPFQRGRWVHSWRSRGAKN